MGSEKVPDTFFSSSDTFSSCVNKFLTPIALREKVPDTYSCRVLVPDTKSP